MWRPGRIATGAEAEGWHDVVHCRFGEVEDRKSSGTQIARDADLSDDSVRAEMRTAGTCANAGVDRNSAVDEFLMLAQPGDKLRFAARGAFAVKKD